MLWYGRYLPGNCDVLIRDIDDHDGGVLEVEWCAKHHLTILKFSLNTTLLYQTKPHHPHLDIGRVPGESKKCVRGEERGVPGGEHLPGGPQGGQGLVGCRWGCRWKGVEVEVWGEVEVGGVRWR